MFSSAKRLFLLSALLLPMGANATSGWYLGGSAGQADTAVDASTVNARLAEQGLTGTATLGDTTRPAWRLFGGYEWNPSLALEGGYTNLGDLEMSLSGTGPLTADQLKSVRPASGSGYELALLGRYPGNGRLNAFARAGLFYWKADYTLNNGSSASFSGNAPFFGVGGELRLNEAWSARLSWDRYTVEHDNTTVIALGLTYRLPFGKHEPAGAPTTLPPTAEMAPTPTAEMAPAVAPPPPAAPPPAPMPAEAPAAAETPPRWVVHFAFARTRPSNGQDALDAAAAHLAAHPQSRVTVIGHTDKSGKEAFSPYLARLRAEAVQDALIARGVEPSRITLESRGAHEPVADNKTRAGRAQNRRAEIVIETEKFAAP